MVDCPPLNNTVEISCFGASYHANRARQWKEINPGLGVGVVFTKHKEDPGSHTSFFIHAGTYTDSYNDRAVFLVGGPRVTLGYENSYHVSADLGLGFLHGSDSKGTALIPSVSAGYDRFNLCVTSDMSDSVAVYARVTLFSF